MARPVASFTQDDVVRAVKGASKTGQLIARVEIDKAAGKIVVFMAGPEALQVSEATNSWDEVLTNAENPQRAS